MTQHAHSHLNPTPRSTHQTQTHLAQMLESQGLRPKRDLGQNFLIDLNLLDLLVREAGIGPRDVVLEIGTGTAGLTSRLAERAAHVISVEIDPGLHRLATANLAPYSNVTLIHKDILANKNKIDPEIMEVLREKLAIYEVKAYSLIANLPYDVSSSVIANAILHEIPVESLTFTVQLEVAQRILASAGSKDYGPLSILAQSVGSARLIRTLSPNAFWPRPKVQSAFVRIDVDQTKRTDPDLHAFHQFVRLLFIHRRKNLRGSIIAIPEFKPLKGILPELLQEIGLSRDDRAERLDPQALRTLHRALLAQGADP